MLRLATYALALHRIAHDQAGLDRKETELFEQQSFVGWFIEIGGLVDEGNEYRSIFMQMLQEAGSLDRLGVMLSLVIPMIKKMSVDSAARTLLVMKKNVLLNPAYPEDLLTQGGVFSERRLDAKKCEGAPGPGPQDHDIT